MYVTAEYETDANVRRRAAAPPRRPLVAAESAARRAQLPACPRDGVPGARRGAQVLNQVVVWDQIISEPQHAWIRSGSVANKRVPPRRPPPAPCTRSSGAFL